MDKREEYEKLKEELDRIKHLPVIVEGKNDKKALASLGINKIIELDTHYKVIEKLEDEKEVVILVDLDKEGKKIYHRLKRDLMKRSVKINDKLREFLFKSTKLRQIEGLPRYMERLKRQIYKSENQA